MARMSLLPRLADGPRWMRALRPRKRMQVRDVCGSLEQSATHSSAGLHRTTSQPVLASDPRLNRPGTRQLQRGMSGAALAMGNKRAMSGSMGSAVMDAGRLVFSLHLSLICISLGSGVVSCHVAEH